MKRILIVIICAIFIFFIGVVYYNRINEFSNKIRKLERELYGDGVLSLQLGLEDRVFDLENKKNDLEDRVSDLENRINY